MIESLDDNWESSDIEAKTLSDMEIAFANTITGGELDDWKDILIKIKMFLFLILFLPSYFILSAFD